jgi:hypothetical protein
MDTSLVSFWSRVAWGGLQAGVDLQAPYIGLIQKSEQCPERKRANEKQTRYT